jgi:hypothetical protein
LTGWSAGFTLTIAIPDPVALAAEGLTMQRMMSVLIVRVALIATVAPGTATSSQGGQEMPGPFRVYVVTGEEQKASPEGLLPSERQNYGDYGRIGKFHDFVTRYGLDPTVAVISRQPPPAADQPLGKLIQSLDQAVEKNKLARLHGWAVFLGLKDDYLKDESRLAQIKQIEAFAKALNLKTVPLALDLADSERTRAYSIAADTAVTVIIYNNLKIVHRWDFTADKPLDDAAVQAIHAEVAKTIGVKK